MNNQFTRLSLFGFGIIIALCSTGCIGAFAQFLYIIKGHDIPAAYSEFESSSVAVVVLTDSSSYGPDPLSDKIEHYIATKLMTNIEDIELVSNREIENWVDINGWDENEMQDLGKGVSADYVLAINVDDYSIREGATMYKGRSEVKVSVIESATGKVTHMSGPNHMEYPENGRPAIQTNDRKFEAFYLAWLTERIARQFYSHDPNTDIADDAAFGG